MAICNVQENYQDTPEITVCALFTGLLLVIHPYLVDY